MANNKIDFDVAGAIKAGHSKQDIVNHLGEEAGFDVTGARNAGYTEDQILRELMGKPEPVPQKESPEAFGMVGAGTGAMYGVGEMGIRGLGGTVVRRVASEIAKDISRMGAEQGGAGGAPPYDPRSPGAKWSDKTGWGAGTGRTVKERVDEADRRKAAEGPIGKAKHGGESIERFLARKARDEAEAKLIAQGRPEGGVAGANPNQRSPLVRGALGTGHFAGRLAAPTVGLGLTGYGAAQAMNRLQEGTPIQDKIAGALNVAGATAGVGSVAKNPRIKYPATAISGGLNYLADLIGSKRDSDEPYAAGGVVGYNDGGSPKKRVAKAAVETAIGKTPQALKNILESKQAPMLRPTGEGSLLPKVDNPYIAEYSDVLPQKRLTRGTNPRMDRLQSDPRAYEAIEKAIQHGFNIDPKLAYWYGTNRLMTGMRNEGRSAEDFERLMKHMASASQRNPVPQQNKMGSLLNYLDITDQLGSPGTKLALPKGYGSLAQADIVKRAQKIGADEYPFDDAIKLGKFYKSYLGYHPENAVVDVIGTRVPTMATRDPEWLVNRLKVGKPKEGYKIISPQDMFKRGELTMEEALKRPGFWEAAPTKVGEYAGIEDMWKSSAKGAGYKSGEGQALGWYGSSGLDDTAGLKSKPMTWEESLEQSARERAKQTGQHPLDVMNKFLKGEGHLKSGGLAHMASGGKTPAWQRKEGKNPEGGLNAKGRASYKAETGGTLKRPQPEGGARRDSFCSRMKGMKKKLTSAKTANDPDSRINKALRKWKC